MVNISLDVYRNESKEVVVIPQEGSDLQMRRIEKYFSRQGIRIQPVAVVTENETIFMVYQIDCLWEQYELFVSLSGSRLYILKKDGCEICRGSNQKRFLNKYKIYKKFGNANIVFSYH